VEIAGSARKHAIDDSDILHALVLPMRQIRQGDADRLLIIGPDRRGRLLEIVILDPDSEEPVVIHAMPLRHKFYRFLSNR
jgi:hypothetical protein